MRILSRKDIEKIADRVVGAYAALPGNAGRPLLKVDPVQLLRRLLGLKIDFRRITEDGSVFGLTTAGRVSIPVYDGEPENRTYRLDGRTVLIDSSLVTRGYMDGERNFAVMHEGSHHILWKLFPEDYGLHCAPDRIYCWRPGGAGKGDEGWEEWQASAMASTILLPEECVRRAMRTFGLGERIERLNSFFEPRVYERFRRAAAFLGVTEAALDARMKRLGLIGEDCFRDPMGIIDVLYDE